MQQILVGTPATLSQSWYVDGTIVDPGAVTVTITKADGTALYTDASASGSGADARTKALTTSDTANLDVLTVVWTSPTYGDLTETVEIVGDLLFTEVEARAFDKTQLSSASSYSDDLIAKTRSTITNELEAIIGTAPIPRYKRVVLSGDGSDSLLLPAMLVQSVRSIEYRNSGETTWTAFSASELADTLVEPYGVIYRETLGTFPAGRRNLRVGYEYGFERVDPRLNEAALRMLVETIRKSDIDPRATSYSDGLGTYRIVTEGLTRGAWRGDPRINAILQHPDFQMRVPAIG